MADRVMVQDIAMQSRTRAWATLLGFVPAEYDPGLPGRRVPDALVVYDGRETIERVPMTLIRYPAGGRK